jgi:hypothetical protein
MTNKVTLHDVYELVDERTKEIYSRIDRIEARVSVLELWKEGLMAKLSMIVAAITFVATLGLDWVKKKLEL